MGPWSRPEHSGNSDSGTMVPVRTQWEFRQWDHGPGQNTVGIPAVGAWSQPGCRRNTNCGAMVPARTQGEFRQWDRGPGQNTGGIPTVGPWSQPGGEGDYGSYTDVMDETPLAQVLPHLG